MVVMHDNKLIRQSEKAKIHSQMQQVYFAQIAHDLRTPLNSLLASSTNLIRTLPGHSKVLQMQKHSILFLINLVEDIIDMTRLQFSKFVINESWFNFDQVINEVLDMCRYQSDLKGIELAKNVKVNPSLMMLSDPKRVKQVLINLIANAIKFTHLGSVRVSAKIIH